MAAVLLGDQRQVNEGDKVKGTGHSVDVPWGDGLLGRVVNALGQPVDEKGPLAGGRRRPVEREAHGAMDRKSVNTPLQTGIKAIDAMVPIGRGQRELDYRRPPDRENGHCAGYHPASEGTGSKAHLRGNRSESFHRGSTRSDTGGFRGDGIYGGGGVPLPGNRLFFSIWRPFAGCHGEEGMEQGKDALIVYDDLSRHAAAYRTISLLLRASPPVEAYPGDVFYLHSRLLERAARLKGGNWRGGPDRAPDHRDPGRDVSAPISHQRDSITDGQIYLRQRLFQGESARRCTRLVGFRAAAPPRSVR